jgi:hypothetical protein
MMLMLYLLVRWLMKNPAESPVSYLSDGILLVAVFLFMAFYRNSLPDKKITLKEAMLFGIGTAVIAAILYGLMLWAVGVAFLQQTALFSTTMTGNEVTTQDPQLHYWAAWWAIYSAVMMALLGSFGAFVAAIFFRNEKSDIKNRKK